VNWQQGIATLKYIPGVPEVKVAVNPIKVYNGSCIYGDKVIVGVEDSKQIAKDVDWPILDITGEKETFDSLYFK
jgi:hypothetical protein